MNLPVRLAPDTRARFTAAEFLRMSEAGAFEGMKVELVAGELERMNPPLGGHSTRQAMVIGALWQVARDTHLTVLAETAVLVDDGTVVACDAGLASRPLGDKEPADPAALLLVVEVSETTQARDLSLKRLLYAAAGIPTYWVVDSARAVIHVHADPIDGDYADIRTVRFGAPLPVPGTDAQVTLG
ncbi:Uma2 family endonuclease [Sphingomonas sp.]|uniref:Uma2 family endonuclease n=1 Tax=Sphingomonas sp. TaxID=28214 RepID=UPI0035B3EB02